MVKKIAGLLMTACMLTGMMSSTAFAGNIKVKTLQSQYQWIHM